DLADLVEEERAAVRELEAPRLARHRAGERAALVAEELALDQLLRDRGAVHLDERLVLPRRVVVERARDELLAGAALAGDEHRRRRVGDALEHVVDLGEAVRRADDPEARAARPGLRRRRLLAGELPRLQRLADDLADLVLVERLREVIERAELQ